ncbi:unnamed protein product [Schistocephalus solidus]|uniref:Uncharacterized protein n=1 Tax=Schistocephalus solidus TaxID=70667 RepID=A0A183SSB1_SCHSO|nr:unnamed protein product [Schistocephalus solidus]
MFVHLSRVRVGSGCFPAGELMYGPDGFLERRQEIEVFFGFHLRRSFDGGVGDVRGLVGNVGCSGPSSVSRPHSRSETGRPTSAGPNGFLNLPPVSSDLTTAVSSKQSGGGAQSVSNGTMMMHDVDAGFGFLLVGGGGGGAAAAAPPPVFSATSESLGLDNPKIPEFLPLVDGFEEELAQQHQQHSKNAPLLCDGVLNSGTQAVSSSGNSKPPLLAFIESQSSGGGEASEPPSLSAEQQLLQNSSGPSGAPLSLQP